MTTSTGPTIGSTRRLLEGTAYFLYGHEPCDLLSFTGHDSLGTQDPNHSHREKIGPSCHQSHPYHQHNRTDQPKRFWAVFHPEKDTLIMSDGATIIRSGKAADSHMFLSGTPHAWGSFPPEMSEPHGCIPPHLYYEVTLLSPYLKSTSVTNNPDRKENRHQRYGFKETSIPFVHRFGDNKDDAGGLTTAYHLLEELESADDYGEFIDKLIHVFCTTVAPNAIRNNRSICSEQVALYACTEVLFSDTKTKQLIQDQFIALEAKTPLPPTMSQFVNHCYEFTESSNAPWILKSDLKILLQTNFSK